MKKYKKTRIILNHMNVPLVDSMKEKKLVIDQAYLYSLPLKFNDWQEKLHKDLTDVFDGGEVYLIPPLKTEYSSLYTDVRCFVFVSSIEGNYIIKLKDEFDIRLMTAILRRRNIVGTYEIGYRFQRK